MPGLSSRLATQIARAMQALRTLPLQKPPGVAESLDWARALVSLHRDHLDAEAVRTTLGCVVKVRDDETVIESHPEALEPVLAEKDPPLEAGGYSLKTDFGFGSVSTPKS
jgi:phage terminase large subunit-like protein